jgi:hypothetical protein
VLEYVNERKDKQHQQYKWDCLLTNSSPLLVSILFLPKAGSCGYVDEKSGFPQGSKKRPPAEF